MNIAHGWRPIYSTLAGGESPAWVMERIGARNLADLIRKAMKLQA